MIFVVIAARDAEAELAGLLRELREVSAPSRERYRVVVVDDDSRDDTRLAAWGHARHLDLALLSHRFVRGTPAALRTGLRCALAESRSDADVVVALTAATGRDPHLIPALVRVVRRDPAAVVAVHGEPAESSSRRLAHGWRRWIPGRRSSRVASGEAALVAMSTGLLRRLLVPDGRELPSRLGTAAEADLMRLAMEKGASLTRMGRLAALAAPAG